MVSSNGGALHREGDQPAIIGLNGHKEWFQWNNHFRYGDKPAIIQSNGMRYWYSKPGKIHRDNDLPAITGPNGYQEWRMDGKTHRASGPAVVSDNGIEERWYLGIKQEG